MTLAELQSRLAPRAAVERARELDGKPSQREGWDSGKPDRWHREDIYRCTSGHVRHGCQPRASRNRCKIDGCSADCALTFPEDA